MAKLINPLMSMSASGQFGKSIVFDKRGHARVYVVPANPKSVNQMLVRNTLGDLQRSLKRLGPVIRAELKAGFGYRWNSMIVGELTANANAALVAYTAEFTAFVGGDKTAWATQDASMPVELTDGVPLYATASAIYDMAARLGVTVTLPLPATANAAAVEAAWVA